MKRFVIIALVCCGAGACPSKEAEDPSHVGTEHGACYPNATCNAGLSCVADECVALPDAAVVHDGGHGADAGKACGDRCGRTEPATNHDEEDASTAEADAATAPAMLGIGSGGEFSCAAFPDGGVQCWGSNRYGRLGNGSTTDSTIPVAVAGLNDAVAVSTGYTHSCALLSDRTVKCWGGNAYGVLGKGTSGGTSTVPVAVAGLTDVRTVSAGRWTSCAVLMGGTVRCWGWNRDGQLGDGTTTDRHKPVAVSGVTTAVDVVCGANQTCALLADGSVECWGTNVSGELGAPAPDTCDAGSEALPCAKKPVKATAISNAVAISARGNYACVLTDAGDVKCWGDNLYGTLGNGSTSNAETPVTVSGISKAVAIAAGQFHACAVLADASARCWGYDVLRRLGRTVSTTCLDSQGEAPCATEPLAVPGVANIQAISAGDTHTCVLRPGNSITCWGGNVSGQLGDGSTSNSSSPVTVLL